MSCAVWVKCKDVVFGDIKLSVTTRRALEAHTMISSSLWACAVCARVQYFDYLAGSSSKASGSPRSSGGASPSSAGNGTGDPELHNHIMSLTRSLASAQIKLGESSVPMTPRTRQALQTAQKNDQVITELEKKQRQELKKRKKNLKKKLAKWEDKKYPFKYVPLGVYVRVDDAAAAAKLLMNLDFQPRDKEK